MPIPEVSTLKVFIRAGIPMIAAWLLLPLTMTIPLIDSTRAPYFDLSQNISTWAYWITQSGGKYGATIVAILMLAILVTRKGITFPRRVSEISIIVLISCVFAGGGAIINEHVIKAELKIPRPNIIWLAGENGSGPLGMTPEDFYEIGDKQARRQPLSNVLQQKPAAVILSSFIREHWVEETGYSFPSGHSFSAMFFATFLLCIAATYVTTRRLGLFYLLIPWALAVCYSRLILRVHTPSDITIGGLQGLILGLIAWIIARWLLQKSTNHI